MSAYSESMSALKDYRKRIEGLRAEMREVQAAIEPEAVADYEFQTPDGPVKLSQLFGAKKDLFVIHNMGRSCPACTMWADGYNGIYDHLADRAAFVISSPDAPDVQQSFAASRGWRFPMVSHVGTTFAEDMGYRGEKGWWPGISVFRKEGERILRMSDTQLGPGDDFNAAWHMFAMLPEGADGWRPKFEYGREVAPAE